jgi:hypothetical protein
MKRIAPDGRSSTSRTASRPSTCSRGARLCNTLPYMPEGVHLAVVDPGVGGTGARSPCATARACSSAPTTASAAAPTARRVDEAHELANPEYALDTSRARSTAATSSRRPPRISRSASRSNELGPPIDRRPSSARRARARGRAEPHPRDVLYVDHFGNMQLNLKRSTSRCARAPRRDRRARARARPLLRGRRPHVRGRRRPATSSSTRTRTGTSRSRSAAAARRRCSASGADRRGPIHLRTP